MTNIYDGFASFARDSEKMHDFLLLSMEEFLLSYSYLSVGDYYATYDEIMSKVTGFETENNKVGV